MRVVLVLLGLSIFSGQAQADDRSPEVAACLAVGGTAASIAIGTAADTASPGPLRTTGLVLAYTGLVVGPSFGHLYAGENAHALRWSMIRALSLAALSSGLYLVFDGPDDRFGAGLALTGVGATGLAIGLTWDLVDARRAAERANRRDEQTSLALVPLARTNTGGIALIGTF
jgi:hypothetical protein